MTASTSSDQIDIFVSPLSGQAHDIVAPKQFIEYLTHSDAAFRTVNDPRSLGDKAVYPLNLGDLRRLSASFAEATKHPVHLFQAFDASAAAAVQEQGNFVLLDYSLEAFFGRQDVMEALYQGISEHDLDPSKVALLNCNMTSKDVFDAARERSGFPHGPKMLPFHGCFWTLVGRNQDKSDEELDSRLGTAERTLLGERRPKKFVSLNGRVRPHRVHTILWLMNNGHIDSGLVSLIAKDSNVLERSGRAAAALKFPEGEELLNNLKGLLDTPLEVDVTHNSYHEARAYKFQMPWGSPDPAIYDSGYFSIVMDTSFHDDDWLFLTPIAFKSFMNLSPFVYFGNPGALEELRRLGFRTFSPFINEEYDLYLNYKERMRALIAELDRLLGMSPAQLHDIYCELWPNLKHNYFHLYRHAKKRFVDDFKERVLEPIGF